jgi:hypothetical protein
VFEANWNSEVVLNLTNYSDDKKTVEIRTTQGRLYTFLRTGDLEMLRSDSVPQLPILVKEANRDHLESISSAFIARVAKEIENPNLFIFACDLTNDVSREKLAAIRDCVASEFTVAETILTPEEAGIKEWQNFAPTINFVALCVNSRAVEKFRDCLKRVLYKPSAARKTQRDGFRLRTHGLFIAPEKNRSSDLVTVSFKHGEGKFYRYRFFQSRIAVLAPALADFLRDMSNGECPNHYFLTPPSCSRMKIDFPVPFRRERFHALTDLAQASESVQKYQSRHENLQAYFLDHDQATFAVEVPVWLEPSEHSNNGLTLPSEGVLTGHIDLLRVEPDGRIGVWDYKPGAYQERFAAAQVYAYAVLLAARTGLPISAFRCGYFDASDAFVFEPENLGQ